MMTYLSISSASQQAQLANTSWLLRLGRQSPIDLGNMITETAAQFLPWDKSYWALPVFGLGKRQKVPGRRPRSLFHNNLEQKMLVQPPETTPGNSKASRCLIDLIVCTKYGSTYICTTVLGSTIEARFLDFLGSRIELCVYEDILSCNRTATVDHDASGVWQSREECFRNNPV